MPGPDGKLTPEERKKVEDWLAKYPKWLGANCPICGSNMWMLAENLVQPVTVGEGANLLLGGVGYPQVMLISNPCGYALFLNAVMIGLLPGSKPVQQPEEDKKA